MPPRYAYWTILIDDKPTAFRAHDKEELLPTLQQLKHTNPNAVMKWFARGKLWDTREQEQAVHKWRKTAEAESLRSRPRDRNAGWASGPPARPTEGGAPREKDRDKRGRDWRPGGEHRDPRARFGKRHRDKRAAGVGVTPERHGAKASKDRPRSQTVARPEGANRRGAWDRNERPQGVGRPSQGRDQRAERERTLNKPSGPPREGGRPGDRRPAWGKKPGGQGDRKPWRKDVRGSQPAWKRDAEPKRGEQPKRDEPKRRDESPDKPPTPEQIVTKPKPPERG